MAITKKSISDLVTAILQGNVVTSQKVPSQRQIALTADMVMHELIHADILQNGVIDGRFFSPAQILAVNYDTVRNRKYTDLKAAPVLGFGTSTILISPVQNDSVQFIYTENISNFIFKGLEAENVLGQTRFTLENKKVYYYNIPVEYTSVLVKAVSSISDLSSTTTIPIPEHLEAEMLKRLLAVFGIQQEQAKQIFVQKAE